MYSYQFASQPTLRLLPPLGHGEQCRNTNAVAASSLGSALSSWGTHKGSWTALSHGNSIFNNLRNCHTYFMSVAQLHSRTNSTQGSPQPRQHLPFSVRAKSLFTYLFTCLLVRACAQRGRHTPVSQRTVLLSQFPLAPAVSGAELRLRGLCTKLPLPSQLSCWSPAHFYLLFQ